MYDLNGNVSTITYPGGRKIAYFYNQLNKVTSVTETYLGVIRTLASNITYQPFGDITSMTYGNGIVTTKAYNNRYQLNNLAIGTLKNLTYTRDNTGNITAITDNLNPSKTKTHTYDRIYSLVGASGYQQGSISYRYDSMSNRTTEIVFTGTTYYNYSGNRLTSTTGLKTFNFSYDNNGNTITENTRQYFYNQNQRMIKAMDGSNVLGEYVYNGNGQRADKLISSQNKCTVFHYDGNGLLITESTRTGNIKAEYVYLNRQPLAKIEGNAIYYYHNDHLGTPMVMTDNSGSVVWQGEYLPFGEPLSVTGSITNNLRFPGQYYDSETGLNQNWWRDYKSEIGRYVEADPIGLLGGVNLFTYVGNSPCNWIDPWGLFKVKICLNLKKLALFDDDSKEVFKADVVKGCKDTPTPTGKFTLGNWQKDKTSKRWGDSSTTPWSGSWWGGNVFGPYFVPVQGTSGVGIHGHLGPNWPILFSVSSHFTCSHGCIRLSNENIMKLHELMPKPVGTQVEIIVNCE